MCMQGIVEIQARGWSNDTGRDSEILSARNARCGNAELRPAATAIELRSRADGGGSGGNLGVLVSWRNRRSRRIKCLSGMLVS